MGRNETKPYKVITNTLAWGVIPLAYLSWCFSTISYINNVFLYLSGILGMLTAVVYMFISKVAVKDGSSFENEIRTLNIAILVTSVLLAFIIQREYLPDGRWMIYLAVVSWMIISALGVKDCFNKELIPGLMRWIKQHLLLLLLLFFAILLSLDSSMYQFKWDGLLYYIAVKDATLSSISSVSLYGHIAMGSGVIYRFFASLLGDVCNGMIFANIVMLLLGTCAFYGCIKKICPDCKEYQYVLGTSCFAFSPFLLGMVDYFSTDWFTVCTAVVLIYFVLKRRWIWTTIIACIFCTTKEPALIAYTGLCFGLVINDLTESKDIKTGFVGLLKKVHYYFMLIPYLLWIVTYKILGQWSAGDGAFGLDPEYILEKSKVFFLINFNWILTLVIVAGIVYLFVIKHFKNHKWWILPLVCSNVFLLMFNYAFKTVNHCRYIDSFISVSLVMAVGFVLTLFSKSQISSGIIGVMAVISLISCYRCIDPVSIIAFDSKNVGSAQVLSTSRLLFGDSAIYNKQMLWIENPIGKAINDCLNEDTAIVMAIHDDSIYSFDGMSEKISMTEDIDKDIQYWDTEKKCRVPYASEHVDKATPITVWHVADGTPIDKIDCDNKDISVIYIKGINDYFVSDEYKLKDSKDYSYRGWIITRDVYGVMK